MASHKVLFIDDDPDVLRTLGDYFEKAGHQVHRAASGKEGIALWEQVKPDVTILDLYMPEMNGIEVLGILRKRRAVVIMLTAYGDIDSAVEAMRLGAENFLSKPIEMSHLMQAVEKAAEKAALREEVVELRARLSPARPAVRCTRGAHRRLDLPRTMDRRAASGRAAADADPRSRRLGAVEIPAGGSSGAERGIFFSPWLRCG